MLMSSKERGDWLKLMAFADCLWRCGYRDDEFSRRLERYRVKHVPKLKRGAWYVGV